VHTVSAALSITQPFYIRTIQVAADLRGIELRPQLLQQQLLPFTSEVQYQEVSTRCRLGAREDPRGRATLS